jgi:fucose permease
MDLLQPMMIVALLLGGLGVALLGSIKVPLARALRIDEARVGGLVSLFGFTLIPVTLTAGFLTDLAGRQVVFIGGSVLFALSLWLLAAARTYGLALAGVILLSAGWGLLMNVGNVMTPLTFPGSTANATNLANVFFGLGAFLTPVVIGWLLRVLSLSWALGLLGVLALVPGLLAPGVAFPAPSVEGGDVASLLADPVLILCALAMFFYGPLEASMAAWSTTYLGDQGVKETTAAGLLSAFWLAFMATRLVTALTLPAGAERLLILVLALVCIAVLALVVASRSRPLAMVLVPATGLVFGPIFPTVMAVLLGHFPAEVQGRAVGLYFAVGGVGWSLIPILIGRYAKATSVQRGLRIAVLAAVGLSVVAGLMVFTL